MCSISSFAGPTKWRMTKKKTSTAMKEKVRVRNEEVRGLTWTDFCPYAESFVFVYHFFLAYSPSVYVIRSTRVYVCMRGSIAVCACLYVRVCKIIERVCICMHV
eukprot:scpid103758/ scgid14316/ 